MKATKSLRVISWAGVGIIAFLFYIVIFWGFALVIFSGSEEIGCTFTQWIIGEHLLVALGFWGSFGATYLLRNKRSEK